MVLIPCERMVFYDGRSKGEHVFLDSLWDSFGLVTARRDRTFSDRKMTEFEDFVRRRLISMSIVQLSPRFFDFNKVLAL